MSRSVRHHRLLVAGLAAIAAAAGSVAPAANAAIPAPDVPADLVPPAGQKPFLSGHAIGVQIYSCTATTDGFAWKLAGPRANLYDANGKLLASHYAGPTWEARDGSRAIGTKQGEVTVDPTAIPWLLLSAKTSAGPDGARLVPTTFIQRINTTDGRAPAVDTCHAGTVGTQEERSYTADYVFYKAA